jgi:hypothetical protein
MSRITYSADALVGFLVSNASDLRSAGLPRYLPAGAAQRAIRAILEAHAAPAGAIDGGTAISAAIDALGLPRDPRPPLTDQQKADLAAADLRRMAADSLSPLKELPPVIRALFLTAQQSERAKTFLAAIKSGDKGRIGAERHLALANFEAMLDATAEAASEAKAA